MKTRSLYARINDVELITESSSFDYFLEMKSVQYSQVHGQYNFTYTYVEREKHLTVRVVEIL